MEVYAKQNMTEAECKNVFTIGRKDIEKVLTMVERDGLEATLSPTTPKKVDKSSLKSTKLKPLVSIKVKLRVKGWRDKSGRRLVGRLKPPKGWKVATKKAKNLAFKRQREEAAAAAIANKPVEQGILKAVAKELLQTHKLSKAKQEETPKVVAAASGKKKPGSPDATKKTISRKRKSATLSTSAGPEARRTTPTAEPTPVTPFFDLFHIPSYRPQQTAMLAPASMPSSKIIVNEDQSLSHAQQSRLIQVLHTYILHPSRSPTERRILLAEEISSTIERLENARTTKQLAKAQAIQKEIKALEEIYKKDLETVPEVANTVGFWRWISETAYFRDIKKDDVYDALDSIVGASVGTTVENIEDGKLWGTLLPPVHVRTVTQDDSSKAVEVSPLFDCLQSLLVEVDGSDDESDDEELLANLPPFTAEQLLHGPGRTEMSNEEVLDLSELSLDQRTYLQLRAVGLIDASSLPSSLPCPIEKETPPQERQCLSSGNVDDVIKKMKSDLSELELTNASAALTLQSIALSDASQSSTRRKQAREQETTLNKFTELQKEQKELRDKRRVSGRVKTGPSKFDGDNWLPG